MREEITITFPFLVWKITTRKALTHFELAMGKHTISQSCTNTNWRNKTYANYYKFLWMNIFISHTKLHKSSLLVFAISYLYIAQISFSQKKSKVGKSMFIESAVYSLHHETSIRQNILAETLSANIWIIFQTWKV